MSRFADVTGRPPSEESEDSGAPGTSEGEWRATARAPRRRGRRMTVKTISDLEQGRTSSNPILLGDASDFRVHGPAVSTSRPKAGTAA